MNAYLFGNSKEKDNKITDEIENHNKQISQYLAKIKDEKSNNEKKRLYEQILELNNVEKQYIIPYLSLIKEKLKKKEIFPDEYKKILKKYDIYIQNAQYGENSYIKESYKEKE